MCTQNCSHPTDTEVDAVERVLAEVHGENVDGYWRGVAEECLEARSAAALRDALTVIDAESAGTSSRSPLSLVHDMDNRIAVEQVCDRELAMASMARIGVFRHYHGLLAEAQESGR